MLENSFKTPLNFSPLQYTYLGKNSIQYHLGLVRLKEIEKWLLKTSVQYIMPIVFHIYVRIHVPYFVDILILWNKHCEVERPLALYAGILGAILGFFSSLMDEH